MLERCFGTIVLMVANRWLLGVVWLSVFCACVGGQQGTVKGLVKLLWPIHFTSMPLSTPERSALESPDFGAQLSRIAVEAFEKYRASTLPRELEIDKTFAEEFANSDHSRVNLAFARWQRRAYGDRFGINVHGLTARGEYAPRLEGIDYKWPEFYDSPLYKTLVMRFEQVAKLYMKRTGTRDIPKRLRIFPWVEVFLKGDAQRPWARTDSAYLMGRYFAQQEKGGLKFNFEDPRGINPPYGKTFSHAAFQGNLILFPTWLSHFITPNMLNQTSVCFAFLVYPPGGEAPLDWEDDATGSLVVERPMQIKNNSVMVE